MKNLEFWLGLLVLWKVQLVINDLCVRQLLKLYVTI
jgi:hypothetical protein